MLKIALTGGDGLVGSRLVELLNKEFEFIHLPQSRMDITDKNAVETVLDGFDYDLFLHLAAYTNVAGAEKEKEFAYQINRDGTRNVFEKVMSQGKNFIYISTDFIFDGKKPPYFEDSVPSPSGIYADSKYEGEKIVREGKGMIVRISYPYRADFVLKKDFFRTFKSYLEEKKPLTMITDSLMTPTFIDDIAFGLKYLINNYSADTFHLVGSKSYSPFEIANLIADKFAFDKSLIGKTDYQSYIKTKPGLPKFSDVRSRKNNFYKMKNFEEGLTEVKRQLQSV